MRRARLVLLGLTIAALGAPVGAIGAEDMPTFTVELKDGAITPLRLEVPANRPFKIDLRNTGTSPCEFESTELHREKVLPGQSASFLVIRKLSPGQYEFFDDFHPDAPSMLLIAK